MRFCLLFSSGQLNNPLQIGARDYAAGVVTVVRRHGGQKTSVSADPATLPGAISSLLNTIQVLSFAMFTLDVITYLFVAQADMINSARKERDSHVSTVLKWDSFVPSLDRGDVVGYLRLSQIRHPIV